MIPTGRLDQLVSLDQSGTPLDPAEWWCAAMDTGAGQTTFTGWFHPGIAEGTRVHLKGHTYHVDSVVNREWNDVSLELTCHEVFE